MNWKKTKEDLNGSHQYIEFRNSVSKSRIIIQRDKVDLRYWHVFYENTKDDLTKTIYTLTKNNALIYAKRWMAKYPEK